jgi:hypothetical protein
MGRVSVDPETHDSSFGLFGHAHDEIEMLILKCFPGLASCSRRRSWEEFKDEHRQLSDGYALTGHPGQNVVRKRFALL